MAKFVHQEVPRATKVAMGVVRYVALNYDEISITNNQFKLFVHCYVMQNWIKIPIIIFLDKVFEGSRSDNLTKVIMEALMIVGCLLKDQNAQILICFKADGVNVFHGTINGVTKQIKDNYTPHFIGFHCMAHHTNLVGQTLSKLPLVISFKIYYIHCIFTLPTQLKGIWSS
jgi:hypothetical protein